MGNKKILVIRMLGLGDVTCIGIPALRYIKQQNPDAEITFLTFSVGGDVIPLAEPQVKVQVLAKEQWPEHIVLAMESFIAVANEITQAEYDEIINLDTWFMPCFLARFLKDSGQNVSGNYMSISVPDLLAQFQAQTLSPDYVNNPHQYMDSSYAAMGNWHVPWWTQLEELPQHGYPEFYLKTCCGYQGIDLDFSISVKPDPNLTAISASKKVIALAASARTAERNYPFETELKTALEAKGYHVWQGFDGRVSMEQTLAQLKSTDLLVTVPSAPQWLAKAVDCPSFVICGDVDPRTIMPEFATEETASKWPPVEEMVNDVEEILDSLNQRSQE
ncbi:hypothetical protein C2869_15770 [Saccharobesus litoralis]|uniref:ADP-heptose:LPS heptosyltransferase n=1 Tax=Saccharobesus litoralis TaxID=2172099 RepID=A0A2S0VUC9_9ALTE|nr:glycosyltransferase family 9 protein [Saccharobesus litoralis]AWB67793.1 hypothetical protein C2869_15770 [Saccharobesus litoralis]